MQELRQRADGRRLNARERLTAERAGTLERLGALERELRGIIESSVSAGTDDEHDPEGATIAYERQYVAALIGEARAPRPDRRGYGQAGGRQLRPV